MSYKGVWFYGISGSGKTYASNFIKSNIDNAFIIDGDSVRENISHDLGYDIDSRLIQLQRILGITKITLDNGFFPICSSVYMSEDLEKKLFDYNILVIRVERDISSARENNPTYDENKDVVGVDISYPKLKSESLINSGGEDFCLKLKSLKLF